MKILMVINFESREKKILERIKQELLLIKGTLQIEIRDMYKGEYFLFWALKFKPDVILTYPITDISGYKYFYVIKFFLKCKIVCLRAEGVLPLVNPLFIELFSGYATYGPKLVDYELFWGRKMAEHIGRNLLKTNKISTMERIIVVGYPRLEEYFDARIKHETLPEYLEKLIFEYPLSRRMLLISGFSYGNYTREDFYAAGDVNAEKNIEDWLLYAKKTKGFREQWITNVKHAARKFEDVLFICKKHPVEKESDYNELRGIKNIVFIKENIDLACIMKYCSLYFHYGSTSLCDAYLNKIPAIYIYCKDFQNSEFFNMNYNDMGWPSLLKIPIDQIVSVVGQHLAKPFQFTDTPEIRAVLEANFNIKQGEPYCPSKQIAELLLSSDPPQKLSLGDIYLWKALVLMTYYNVRPLITGPIKKLLGYSRQLNRS